MQVTLGDANTPLPVTNATGGGGQQGTGPGQHDGEPISPILAVHFTAGHTSQGCGAPQTEHRQPLSRTPDRWTRLDSYKDIAHGDGINLETKNKNTRGKSPNI